MIQAKLAGTQNMTTFDLERHCCELAASLLREAGLEDPQFSAEWTSKIFQAHAAVKLSPGASLYDNEKLVAVMAENDAAKLDYAQRVQALSNKLVRDLSTAREAAKRVADGGPAIECPVGMCEREKGHKGPHISKWG